MKVITFVFILPIFAPFCFIWRRETSLRNDLNKNAAKLFFQTQRSQMLGHLRNVSGWKMITVKSTLLILNANFSRSLSFYLSLSLTQSLTFSFSVSVSISPPLSFCTALFQSLCLLFFLFCLLSFLSLTLSRSISSFYSFKESHPPFIFSYVPLPLCKHIHTHTHALFTLCAIPVALSHAPHTNILTI